MDYAEYVTRRPPSPPLPPRHPPFTASPSLSSAASTPRAAASLPHAPSPPAPSSLSSHLHRRALRDEYAALTRDVASAAAARDAQHRQEAVRIRLEDMLTRADPPSQRVLHVALDKCNARLDVLATSTRPAHAARARMRVIEGKHLLGPRAPAPPVPPPLRALHIRRDAVATLVEHIACALHDQVRIHYLLSVLSSRLAALRAALAALDRADRPPPRAQDRAPPRRTSFTNAAPASSPPRDGFVRRVSRSALRAEHAPDAEMGASPQPDRPASRTNVLRSQRSLPRRSDARRLPLVVRRALSYNSTPEPRQQPPEQPPAAVQPPVQHQQQQHHQQQQPQPQQGQALPAQQQDPSWWAADSALGRSEPRLSVGDMRRAAPSWLARGDLVGGLAYRLREEGESLDDESFPPVSPVSHCTTNSDGSPRMDPQVLLGRGSGGEFAFDQSVLVDIDSLCTEASSVLSSSRGMGMDTASTDKPVRRGSVSSALFHGPPSGIGESLRMKALGRFRLSRMRIPSQIKKLWMEINELYGIVLTHGPHLLEEKIVTRASMATGLLGPWNSRRGKSASFRTSFQVAAVIEAMRKLDGITLWQQRLIVAIRRDYLEQRKALRTSDQVISEAYMQLLDAQQERR